MKPVIYVCNVDEDSILEENEYVKTVKKIAAKEISETLYNRGKILLVDKQKDGSWEIWIRDSLTDENFAYYLFPYDNGVVEVE